MTVTKHVKDKFMERFGLSLSNGDVLDLFRRSKSIRKVSGSRRDSSNRRKIDVDGCEAVLVCKRNSIITVYKEWC